VTCVWRLITDDAQSECKKAVNDMVEGEEVFTGYVKPHRSFESRHGALQRNWLFDCDCSLCKADKTPGDRHQDRANMMVNEWPALESEAVTHTGISNTQQGTAALRRRSIITRLAAFADKIDATYARGRSAKLELSQVSLVLADLWSSLDPTKALKVSVL
jgi:hypothetical protein